MKIYMRQQKIHVRNAVGKLCVIWLKFHRILILRQYYISPMARNIRYGEKSADKIEENNKLKWQITTKCRLEPVAEETCDLLIFNTWYFRKCKYENQPVSENDKSSVRAI